MPDITPQVRSRGTPRCSGSPHDPISWVKATPGSSRNTAIEAWAGSMKAVMMEKVLWDRPQVTQVRTYNAESNAPMLSINREMGFKHVLTAYDWQVDVDRVFEYLDSRHR